MSSLSHSEPRNLKRSRPVTRSPSPDDMEVDQDVSPPETITVDTKLKPSNMGYAMLQKFGWTEGQPLGLDSSGRTEPISTDFNFARTGLGKTKQDFRMIETTVSQRRNLDSERQQKETEDERRAREEIAARKHALQEEITDTLKAFYCVLCDKQFKNVAQYDEHTNSYAHHHKARYKDMQTSLRMQAPEELDKRKEKERKREEKELRKIAAANGIKMTKSSAIVQPLETNVSDSGFKRAGAGWSNAQNSFKTGGWAPVDSSSTSVVITPNEPSSSSNASVTTETQPVRSSWQQFNSKSSSKR